MVPQPCTRTQACCEVFYSDCWDCSLIAEIAVWLWRLPSGMSGMRQISERKANALNFFILSSQPIRGFDFGLSTNGKPLFQVLRFWLTSKIRLQSQQSDCNLSNQTAISAIRLQSQQSECNLSNQTAISAIRLQSSCIAAWLCRLQFDCGDYSLIVKIAVELWRL